MNMKIYQLFWTMMKNTNVVKLFFILWIILPKNSFGQYNSIVVFPQDNSSILVSVENIGDANFGFQIGSIVQIGMTSSPYIYRTPFVSLNRFGINAGILNCGIVLAFGAKIDMLSGPKAIFYPDYMVKLQPLKLLSGNKNIWDVCLVYDYSDNVYYGFGISIPLSRDYR